MDSGGYTALMRAAEAGHASIATALIDAGADMNAADRQLGRTALMIAVAHDHVDVLIALHRRGAELNAMDSRGYPALMIAAEYGSLNCIRELQTAGVDINVTIVPVSGAASQSNVVIEEGRGPALIVALWRRDTRAIDTLLQAGASPDCKGSYGRTALMWAVIYHLAPQVERMVKTANLEEKDDEGCTALMFVRRRAIAQSLIDARANIHAVCDSRTTPLMNAASRGDLAVIETLLDNVDDPAAYIDVKDNRGYTSLMMAAETGQASAISTLAKRGANVEARALHSSKEGAFVHYHYGDTALMIAARRGFLGAVEALLDSKADIDAVNNEGSTPLILAAQHQRLLVLNALCWAGANVNAKNCNGLSALMLAAKRGDLSVITQLHRFHADLEVRDGAGCTALMFAAAQNDVYTVRKLSQIGANLNASDHYGMTALMIVGRNGNMATFGVLIALGADVNARNRLGGTALMDAAERGMEDQVRILLSVNADPNIASNDGFTALMSAARNGQLKIIDMLLRAKANVNARARGGETALSYAVKAQAKAAELKLVKAGAEYNFPLTENPRAITRY
jgi:ankyrin repeat protein